MTTLNKNDKKAVKRAVQWLREYSHESANQELCIESREIARALEQVLERNVRTRDDAKQAACKYSVKQNAWDNWNGYCGKLKVKEFGTREDEAREWLRSMNANAAARAVTLAEPISIDDLKT